MSKVTLRPFEEKDVENKVKWINNPENNIYLHYNIPLNYEDTLSWYRNHKNDANRHDMIMEYDGIPVGVIGIINIDKKKGEYYITLGDNNFRRKGISYEATNQIITKAFNEFGVEKIWLCVDAENVPARRLYEKVGFKLEGMLRKDIFFKGKMIDRCIYGIIKEEWQK